MPYDTKGILKRAIPEYQQGARIADLAARYKISVPYMYSLLRASGIEMRPPGLSSRKPFDEEAAVKAYLEGTSILRLATEFSIARGSLLNRFKERGLKIRSASEQSFISAARQSPAERSARAAAAHAAVRGSKKSKESLIQAAINRQERCKMTTKEVQWRQHLLDAGIITVPQYAVDKYTIDLAVPDARLAIEVKSGWSSGRLQKGTYEKARTAALISLGWLVVNLYGSDWRPGWVEKVQMYLEQRRAMRLS